MKTKDIVIIGMFASILAVISQISLPIAAVPVTIQVFGIALVGAVLGWKKGVFAVLVYILLGAIGLPIFSGFRGGIQVIAGMSGGYIIGWIPMVLFCGLDSSSESRNVRFIFSIILAVIGLMLCEIIGGLWWWNLARGGESPQSFAWIMTYSFTAFIPKDILITVLGILIGRQIRKTLIQADLLR